MPQGAPWEDYAATSTQQGPWQDYAQSGGGDPSSGAKPFKVTYQGKTYTFDAPEGSSHEDLAKLGGRELDRRGIRHPGVDVQLNGEPKPEPQPLSLMQRAGLGVRDVIQGAGNIADMFAAPLNAGINMVTGANMSTTPFADAGNAVADKAGLPNAGTDQEKLASATVRGMTQAAVPIAGAEMLAARGVKAAAPFATQKLAQLASGATGGASGEVARQSGAGPVTQTLASIAGGVIPVSAAAGVRAAVSRIGTGFGNGAQNAAEKIGQAAYDKSSAISSIGNAPKPTDTTLPTLAEVAKDPGLAAFQRSRTTTPVTERQATNAVARGQAADTAMGAGNPQAVQDLAATTEATRAADVVKARSNVGPVADRVESSGVAREAFDKNYAAARAKTSAAYNVPALTEATPIDIPKPVFQDIARQADEFYGDGGGVMPPKLQEILADMAGQGSTTRTLTNIDRRLADFAGEARMAGRAREASFADGLGRTLDAHVNEIMPPEYREALGNAKRIRAEQGRMFETGAAPEALAVDQYRNPTTGDVQLPTKLVRPGAAGGDTAEGLIAATGAAPAETVARQEMRRLVDEKQLDTSAQVEALAGRYGEALQRFPSLKNDIDALRDRAALLDAYKSSPLGQMADATVDPAQAIAQMVSSKDGGRKLRALADQVRSNPDAIDGLRRSLGAYLTQSMKNGAVTAEGQAIPDAKKAREAIDAVLQRAGQAKLLTGQQRIALERIRQEFASVTYASKAGVAKSPDGSPMAFVDAAGHIPHVAWYASTIKWLHHNLGNGKEVDALLEKAILDPSFASELLAKPTPERLKTLRATISASVRGAASSATQATGSDNGDPPL